MGARFAGGVLDNSCIAKIPDSIKMPEWLRNTQKCWENARMAPEYPENALNPRKQNQMGVPKFKNRIRLAPPLTSLFYGCEVRFRPSSYSVITAPSTPLSMNDGVNTFISLPLLDFTPEKTGGIPLILLMAALSRGSSISPNGSSCSIS